ncbi:tail fiber domain-containing protein [Photobacterium damselae]|uniref:tail fiber domain-containing protein n=1 Tax=Photobacterium damselae TaxID=38293 RepID=UPI001F388847|nr:tail fiber domain-containing protein [Photobacterium damselae]UKA12933.1 tail fiber domain-containing protein [Photobacterium damselae subsp. damselae]
MAIQFKRKIAHGKPVPADLKEGELCLNLEDKSIFTKDHHGNIIAIGGAGGGITEYVTQSPGTTQLDKNKGYLCKTTDTNPKPFTLTVPTKAIENGTLFAVGDYNGHASKNEIKITAPKGTKIMGRDANFVIGIDYACVVFSYIAAEKDWRIIAGAGESAQSFFVSQETIKTNVRGQHTFKSDNNLFMEKGNADVYYNQGRLVPGLGYKFNKDGSITLIDGEGAYAPVRSDRDVVTMLVYNRMSVFDFNKKIDLNDLKIKGDIETDGSIKAKGGVRARGNLQGWGFVALNSDALTGFFISGKKDRGVIAPYSPHAKKGDIDWDHTLSYYPNSSYEFARWIMTCPFQVGGEGEALTLQYKKGGHGYIRGKRGDVNDWYLGRGSDTQKDVVLSNSVGGNFLSLGDDKSISFTGSRHNFNATMNVTGSINATEIIKSGRYFQTAAAAYPSLTLQGEKGIKLLLEFDAGRETTNLIHRANSGANQRTWRFDKEGRIHSDKGIISEEANLGVGGYNTIWDAECPFIVENLYTRGDSASMFAPMLVGRARPAKGAWLAVSFGGFYDGTNTDAAAINITDLKGKDQKAWLFKRNGDAAGKAWVQVSDRREKKNINPLLSDMSAMAIVNSFDGKTYSFKGESRIRYGFVAQEVAPNYPHAVSESGFKDNNEKSMLALDYTSIIPLHHEALKELEKENLALKKRIDKIEKLLATN